MRQLTSTQIQKYAPTFKYMDSDLGPAKYVAFVSDDFPKIAVALCKSFGMYSIHTFLVVKMEDPLHSLINDKTIGNKKISACLTKNPISCGTSVDGHSSSGYSTYADFKCNVQNLIQHGFLPKNVLENFSYTNSFLSSFNSNSNDATSLECKNDSKHRSNHNSQSSSSDSKHSAARPTSPRP